MVQLRLIHVRTSATRADIIMLLVSLLPESVDEVSSVERDVDLMVGVVLTVVVVSRSAVTDDQTWRLCSI